MPFSPTNSSVPTWNSRTAPSACDEEVRIFVAQNGQTASLSSRTGGCGRMSSCVTFDRTLAERRADTVRCRIAAADHHHVFPVGDNRFGRPADGIDVFPCHPLVLLDQERHRIVDAGQFDTGNAGIARLFRTAAIEHRIVFVAQRIDGLVDSDMHIVVEDDTLAFHLHDAFVDIVFFHLEIGNAVAQQAAGGAFALIDMHVMADACQLLGRGHALPAPTR